MGVQMVHMTCIYMRECMCTEHFIEVYTVTNLGFVFEWYDFKKKKFYVLTLNKVIKQTKQCVNI